MKFNAIISLKQILKKWYDKDFMTVRKFINQLRQWQQAGCISEDVWSEVNALVNLESLPAQKTDPDNVFFKVPNAKIFPLLQQMKLTLSDRCGLRYILFQNKEKHYRSI